MKILFTGGGTGGHFYPIIAVAEGARSIDESRKLSVSKKKKSKENTAGDSIPKTTDDGIRLVQEPMASRIARQLQHLTGVEARVTSLGHVQRGGEPTPFDRLLCTRLGTAAGMLLAQGHYNVMVALQGDKCVPVPLGKVAGRRKTVPPDHPWVETARLVSTCLGV